MWKQRFCSGRRRTDGLKASWVVACVTSSREFEPGVRQMAPEACARAQLRTALFGLGCLRRPPAPAGWQVSCSHAQEPPWSGLGEARIFVRRGTRPAAREFALLRTLPSYGVRCGYLPAGCAQRARDARPARARCGRCRSRRGVEERDPRCAPRAGGADAALRRCRRCVRSAGPQRGRGATTGARERHALFANDRLGLQAKHGPCALAWAPQPAPRASARCHAALRRARWRTAPAARRFFRSGHRLTQTYSGWPADGARAPRYAPLRPAPGAPLQPPSPPVLTTPGPSQVSAPLRAAFAAAAGNALLAAPAFAEPGKIFDFNLTLPLMAGQFLVLMVVLDKLVYSPVGKVLDDRDAQLRSKLEAVKDNSSDLLKFAVRHAHPAAADALGCAAEAATAVTPAPRPSCKPAPAPAHVLAQPLTPGARCADPFASAPRRRRLTPSSPPPATRPAPSSPRPRPRLTASPTPRSRRPRRSWTRSSSPPPPRWSSSARAAWRPLTLRWPSCPTSSSTSWCPSKRAGAGRTPLG